MRNKSKFLTFLLSFIPGLGHIYLGFASRGAMFFAAITAVGVLTGILAAYFHSDSFLFVVALIPVIWLAAMVDSMILVEKINLCNSRHDLIPGDSKLLPDYGEIAKQNKKAITMFLSIIPGVGHLYLGLQRQGLELMLSFFLLFYLSDWLQFSAFMILAPIIWFYGIFDVMHKVSGTREMKDDDLLDLSWFSESSFVKNKGKLLGYGLVVIGLIILLNRMIFPYIQRYFTTNITDDFQTAIVALLFILGGIRLIIGNRRKIPAGKEI